MAPKAKHRRKAARTGAFEQVVCTLIGMFCDLGCVCLNREHGHKAPSSEEWATWRRLAAVIVARLVDPVIFIKAQFLSEEDKHILPAAPEHLFYESCFDRYEAWIRGPNRLREVKIHLDHMRNCARATMIEQQESLGQSAHDAALEVLIDPNEVYSPLFLYALVQNLARQYPQDAAFFMVHADRLEEEAAIEYVRHKFAYDRTWLRDWLPADFRERAADIYERAFADCEGTEEG